MKNKPLLILSLIIVLLVAACGGSDSPVVNVPTRVDLPSATPLPPTETPTLTPTPLPVTFTPTVSPTETATISVTPSATITETVTRTPTNTPTFTITPVPTVEVNGLGLLLTQAALFTPLPTQFQIVAPLQPTVPAGIGSPGTLPAPTQCQYLPAGGFGQLYTSDTTLAAQLGCPIGAPPVAASLAAAGQSYERGAMIYINNPPGVIYVLNSDGTFQRYDDAYVDGVDPVNGGQTPPSGLQDPQRGFGKVWRTNDPVRTALGWATNSEQGATATVQDFAQGRMLYLPIRGDILVLIYSGGNPAAGTWRSVAGQF